MYVYAMPTQRLFYLTWIRSFIVSDKLTPVVETLTGWINIFNRHLMLNMFMFVVVVDDGCANFDVPADCGCWSW